MLMASEAPDVYTRVGYFRAIETFRQAPRLHPKGVNLEDEILQHGWFGKQIHERTIGSCEEISEMFEGRAAQ
jgi:hypothetical protein